MTYRELQKTLKAYRDSEGYTIRCPLNSTKEDLQAEYNRIKADKDRVDIECQDRQALQDMEDEHRKASSEITYPITNEDNELLTLLEAPCCPLEDRPTAITIRKPRISESKAYKVVTVLVVFLYTYGRLAYDFLKPIAIAAYRVSRWILRTVYGLLKAHIAAQLGNHKRKYLLAEHEGHETTLR